MRLGEGSLKGEESLKWEGPHKGEGSFKWEGPHNGEGPYKGEESFKWEGPHNGEGPYKGEESFKWEGPHNGEGHSNICSTQVFASSSIWPIVHNWPAQIEMITSGKSDEKQIHSNKIKIFMYLKIQMYIKKNKCCHCCSVGMFGAKCLGNFDTFLKIHKTIIFLGWTCLCFIRCTNCYNISSTFISGSQSCWLQSNWDFFFDGINNTFARIWQYSPSALTIF